MSLGMKRFSKEHVTQTAREFARSRFAASWYMFGAEIQSALIDAHVMAQIRMAHVADSEQTFTATEIIEFRDAVAACLAEGVVPANSRAMRRSFKVEE